MKGGGGDIKKTKQNHAEQQLKLERLPLCGMKDYASGSWVRWNREKKNFVCCGSQVHHDYGTAESQYCQEPPEIQGLERAYSGDGAPFKYFSTLGRACSCDTKPSTPDRVLDFENYEWQPSTCRLDAFNADNFCSMLGHRHLLVVGDSTAAQTGNTLMNMIIAGSLDGKGCSHHIEVRRTDFLGQQPQDRTQHVEWSEQNLENTSFGNPFSPEFDLETATAPEFNSEKLSMNEFNQMNSMSNAIQSSQEDDVVMLSSGPHWFSTEQYLKMLRFVIKEIQEKRERGSKNIFLWKTINGAGCGSMGADSGEKQRQENARYGWNNFMTYDAMAEAVMQSISPPVPLVNVSMLYQRGDAHPGSFPDLRPNGHDCLHFCTPGPLDVIAPILSHVLLQLNT